MHSSLSSKSERNFGFLIASATTCFLVYRAVFQSPPLYLYFLGLVIVAGILLISFLKPCLFSLPLRLWMKLGYYMGIFISPIVLGVIFFGMITPVAVVARYLGRDLLNLNKYTTATYWVKRDPSRQPSNSFKNQF